MGAAAEGRARPFYLLGWQGSRALDRILGPVGCGCELARTAVLSGDADEREVAANDAPGVQRRWRCPAAGYAPAASRDELDPACRAVLADADALCEGADCGTTCPKALAREPVAHAVMGARQWREHGELRARLGWPSLALCEAMDAMDRGVNDRLEWERKHPPTKHEREPDPPPDE